MASLKGTLTGQNLLKAFNAEFQARDRHLHYALIARNEGLQHMAGLFTETADNETAHAHHFFQFLEGGMVNITSVTSLVIFGTTLDNLQPGADGYQEDWSELYPTFSEIAKKEGFAEISKTFSQIEKVEKAHKDIYHNLWINLNLGKVLEKDGVLLWKCRNCNNIHEGNPAPDQWPACNNLQNYF